MQLHCPHCFAKFSLESAVEDDAGRELMGLLAKHPEAARSLVIYLGLFRSATRRLAWTRALAIAHQVVGMGDIYTVNEALLKTIDAMREKQDTGEFKPLKNNQYFKRVLEATPKVAPIQQMQPVTQPIAPKSKTGQALMGLENLRGTEQ